LVTSLLEEILTGYCLWCAASRWTSGPPRLVAGETSSPVARSSP